MDIGVSFQVPNEHGFVLNRILRCISANDLLWKITDDEVFVKSHPFPLQGLYNWDELIEKLPQVESYVVFCMLKAYSETENKIETLEQFLEGSCELAIFIIDVTKVELYCKSKYKLTRIADELSREFDIKVLIINTENCTRNSWIEY